MDNLVSAKLCRGREGGNAAGLVAFVRALASVCTFMLLPAVLGLELHVADLACKWLVLRVALNCGGTNQLLTVQRTKHTTGDIPCLQSFGLAVKLRQR